jgi:hypothetical protein
MPSCKKCHVEFPNYMKIDGKVRHLGSRKYCLECSPFGCKNRRQLEKGFGKCIHCGCTLKTTRRKVCCSCQHKIRRERIRERIYDIVGRNCWICDFSLGGKSSRVLGFHHVKKEEKSFPLTAEFMEKKRWIDVENEIKKCVVLCPNCHMTFHYTDIISDEDIESIYKKKWKELEK